MLLAESLLGSSSLEPVYIEDTFSTYLYTGTGAAQTITNGINLAGNGGLVWIKSRSATTSNFLFDTNRGALNEINSDTTGAQASLADSLTAFNSDGFSISSATGIGVNAETYASWTFRKQPKFFDVVTYTGNGANRTIAHSLGSVPGCIIVKRTNTTGDWQVYHRANTAAPETDYLVLNSTAATADSINRWNDTLPTSTVFSLGADATVNSIVGGTYVAYLFAHDAGGFGDTGADNVISCGSYTGNGSATGPTVTLGYEPQWLLIKRTDTTGDWNLIDNVRGFVVGGTDSELNPNLSAAESTGTFVTPTATGFQLNTTDVGYNANTGTYIYIAIRRGPMRTPTSGTEVFGLNARTGTGVNATVTGGQTVDAVLIKRRNNDTQSLFSSRLTGLGYLVTSSTAAEVAAGTTILQANPWDVMDGVKVGTTSIITNDFGDTYINYLFRRAPGFFDAVCYTGDGTVNDVNHNLGVVPELIIGKRRNSTGDWAVYSSTFNGGVNPHQYVLYLNQTTALAGAGSWFLFDQPTATRFRPTTILDSMGGTYVAYLFASAPGVSKVGSYTGTGATQTIDCGFAAGARFVLVKRTDNTGSWFVWDTARGIVAGNDPFWRLESADAENTSTDWVDTAASGFELSAAGNSANISGASYIFLAIA